MCTAPRTSDDANLVTRGGRSPETLISVARVALEVLWVPARRKPNRICWSLCAFVHVYPVSTIEVLHTHVNVRVLPIPKSTMSLTHHVASPYKNQHLHPKGDTTARSRDARIDPRIDPWIANSSFLAALTPRELHKWRYPRASVIPCTKIH